MPLQLLGGVRNRRMLITRRGKRENKSCIENEKKRKDTHRLLLCTGSYYSVQPLLCAAPHRPRPNETRSTNVHKNHAPLQKHRQ